MKSPKKKGQIKFIYFDLGGVVLNWRNSMRKLSELIGQDHETIEKVFNRHVSDSNRGHMKSKDQWDLYKSSLGFSMKEHEDFASFWTSHFLPIKETHTFLRELVPQFQVGILSNIEHGVYDGALQRGHIPDLPYSVVIQSCHVGLIKPEREIYELARERAGVAHHEILFTDDRSENVQAAIELGWKGIIFDEHNPSESLAQIRSILGV